MKQVGEFLLTNDEKVNRTIYGSLTRDGKLSGGVGDEAPDEKLLAEYDKLGGHIVKKGLTVKQGSFFNFKAKKPHEKPNVAFIINVDGENVEGTEEEASAIKAAKDRIKEMKNRKKVDGQGSGEQKVKIPAPIFESEELEGNKPRRSKKSAE